MAGYPSTATSHKPDRRGRDRNRKQGKASQRRNAGVHYWEREEHPLVIGQDQFRVVVERGDEKDYVVLDQEITSLSWDDASDVMTGSVTWLEFEHEFHKQDSSRLKHQRKHQKPPLIPETGFGGIKEGHLFVLHWRASEQARWKEVWQMRAWQPQIAPLTGEITMLLRNDLGYLSRSQDHFRYGKSKKNPDGMTLASIIQAIAKRYQVKLAKLPKLTYKDKHFKVDGSPIEAIQHCLLIEKNSGSGRRYFMRSTTKGLEILPLQRSRDMLIIGPALIDASIQRSLGTQFITALTVRGSLKGAKGSKSKKRHKISIKVSSPAAIRRFGYIHGEVTAPKGTTTTAAAREYGRKILHKRFKPKTTVTLTHPGIPTLKRYDAALIQMPDEGVNLLAFATEVQHTVSPGDYSMDITCRFTDPFVDKSKLQRELKKCEAAQRRHRKLSAKCSKLLREHKKDAKHDQRANK